MDALEELIGPGPRDAKLGDNQPPDLATALQQELEEDALALLTRKDQLLAGVARVPATVEDEETAMRVADLVRLIAATVKVGEDKRVARKEPFLAGGRAVDAFFKNRLIDPLARAKRQIEERLTIYQRRKAEEARRAAEAEARRKTEEAERLRLEAAEREKTFTTEADLDQAITTNELARQAEGDAVQAQKVVEQKPAEFSRTRGDLGAVASLRTVWDFKDLARADLDLEALRPYLGEDALKQAIRGFIRANFQPGHPGRQIAGVTIFENTVTAVR